VCIGRGIFSIYVALTYTYRRLYILSLAQIDPTNVERDFFLALVQFHPASTDCDIFKRLCRFILAKTARDMFRTCFSLRVQACATTANRLCRLILAGNIHRHSLIYYIILFVSDIKGGTEGV
jgi:hypothetical protein